MTLETSLIDSALRNWRSNIDRAGKLFGNLSQEQLLQEVAPGKNRLIYLWGHITAFNDALIPLLGFGARIHPELDLMFVSNPDRTVPTILLGQDLKTIWQETSEILWTGFTKLSVADWLQKHSAVSEEDFLQEPHRNRFTVVLGRTAHIAYHVGQESYGRECKRRTSIDRGPSLCVTEQPSNAVAEASKWSDVMAKVIEFYIRGSFPKKADPVPMEERGKLIEFPKEEFAAQSRTEDTERGDVRPSTVVFFGCF